MFPQILKTVWYPNNSIKEDKKKSISSEKYYVFPVVNARCCQDALNQNKAQDIHTSAGGLQRWDTCREGLVNFCVSQRPLPAHIRGS